MRKPSEFLPVTVSMRASELDLLDTAAKQYAFTRSEFVRVTVLAGARATLEAAVGSEDGES